MSGLYSLSAISPPLQPRAPTHHFNVARFSTYKAVAAQERLFHSCLKITVLALASIARKSNLFSAWLVTPSPLHRPSHPTRLMPPRNPLNPPRIPSVRPSLPSCLSLPQTDHVSPTSAGRGVVTAENVASINQPSEGREQSHRKLQNGVKTASDGTPCNVVATRTAGSCRSTGCLETLYKQQRDCGLLVPTTQSGHGKGKIGSGRIPMPF
ncbi:unnamed protein product [Closterium sp. NIES-65]|nr:unnamed protein product [Closterium sp. NIES-65]